jgi:hypothetical protein
MNISIYYSISLSLNPFGIRKPILLSAKYLWTGSTSLRFSHGSHVSFHGSFEEGCTPAHLTLKYKT